MALDFLQLRNDRENAPERPLPELSLLSRQEFPAFFQELHQSDSRKAIRTCILHLSEKGADSIGEQLITSLSATDHYLLEVLDPAVLSLESAKRVCLLFRKADPYFFAHLSRLAFNPPNQHPPSFTSRALAILDDLSKDDPIVPWLYQLTKHPDERVRSKAVKVLCRLRPSKSTVELHLQSADHRVRANAIEALWHSPVNDAVAIFRSVLGDSHHRVVMNALVGLYYHKDPGALQSIIELTAHPSANFRVAVVWALGAVADRRAIPTLRKLLDDPSEPVREKAQRVLATFGPDPKDSVQKNPENSLPFTTGSFANSTDLPQVA
jgi:hypothetical protein